MSKNLFENLTRSIVRVYCEDNNHTPDQCEIAVDSTTALRKATIAISGKPVITIEYIENQIALIRYL